MYALGERKKNCKEKNPVQRRVHDVMEGASEFFFLFSFISHAMMLTGLIGSSSFLEGDGGFFTHSGDDGNHQVLTFIKSSLQTVTQFTFWSLDIILSVTVHVHQRQETVINVQQLVFVSLDNWNFHVVSRWRQIFQLLTSEDITGNQMDFSVTVLTSLRSGHVDNLTWSTLDDDETVLSQGRTLHWVGGGGTSVSSFKGVFFVRHCIYELVFVCVWESMSNWLQK